MGRATIISETGAGYYTIKVDLGASKYEARVVYYQLQVLALDPVIEEYQANVDSERDEYQSTLSELNATINEYVTALQTEPQPPKQALDELRQNVIIATKNSTSRLSQYQANDAILDGLKLKKENLTKQIAAVQGAEKDRTIGAWCADYTTGATGEVQTVEVPGEPQDVLIYPQAPPPAIYTGITLARAAMSPEQAYFNAAILPGWQKFMPIYRFGEITAIDVDANTADVTLDVATSSAQGLPINAVSGHSGIPVQYMDCHAAAFEVGDHVLLMYPTQDPEDAQVIGFADNPKPCAWSAWYGSWNGAVHYMNGYLGMGTAIEDYFEDTAADYSARWNGSALPVNYDSSTGRMWGETSTSSELKPQIEVLKAAAFFRT